MWQRLIEGIYMPHGYCLLWEPWLVGLHAISDVLTFGAYSAIPLAIWIFVSKRPHLELKGLARLFAAFILWCGLTHLFGAITLWYPVYELQALVKAATATISVTTAVLIFPLIPKALAIPSPTELQVANAQLEFEVAAHKRTLEELQRAQDELEERVAARTRDLAEATERFKALFEHAPVAMLMLNRAGVVQQVNGAAEQVFASGRSDLLGNPIDALLTRPSEGVEPGAPHREAEHRELTAQRPHGVPFPAEVGFNPIPDGGELAMVVSVVDISERRKQAERLQFIMRELSHRSKNLLAVIQGMVRQAVASSSNLKSFERSFSDRLQGLARSHDLLVGRNWEGASLGELVKAQLAFLRRGDWNGLTIAGPDLMLTPEAAQNLGLALHELATNAAKHGALRAEGGTIGVAWRISGGDDRKACLTFDWTEHGGPPVDGPHTSGFGRVVLERVVPGSMGGSASLAFAERGVHWHLTAPLDMLTARPAAAAEA